MLKWFNVFEVCFKKLKNFEFDVFVVSRPGLYNIVFVNDVLSTPDFVEIPLYLRMFNQQLF